MKKAQPQDHVSLAWAVRGLGAALAALGVGLLWWGVIAPTHRRHLDQVTRLDALELMAEGAAKQAARLHEEQLRRDALLESWKTAQARIPSTAEEAEYLSQLHQAATRCHLNIVEFRPTGVMRAGPHEERSVQLMATGSYEGICRFLDALRDSPRMTRVTTLEVGPLDGSRTLYSFSAGLVIFTSPEAPSTSSGKEPAHG